MPLQRLRLTCMPGTHVAMLTCKARSEAMLALHEVSAHTYMYNHCATPSFWKSVAIMHAHLHLEHLRPQSGMHAFIRVRDVAHTPAHHPIGFREREDVDNVAATDTRMLHTIICEVLIRVVHNEPAPCRLCQGRCPLQLRLRKHEACTHFAGIRNADTIECTTL
jgi:hypothetical protein